MFCTSNANKSFKANKDITSTNNYLDKENLAQNKNFIDQDDSNVKLLNLDSIEYLENVLTNAYKKNKLI